MLHTGRYVTLCFVCDYNNATGVTLVAIKKKCHIYDKEQKLTQNSDDLRVRRTRKLLREALIELIGERSFDTITVGDISQRAMVSRAAFYRHYQDK
jgi:AraC-like DNA-binding protein